MHTLKRTRYWRLVSSWIVTSMVVPLWLLPAAMAQGNVAQPPPVSTGAGTGQVPPPDTTATQPPVLQPAPPVSYPQRLLVWPLDASHSGVTDTTVPLTAAADVTDALSGSSRWQAVLLDPDAGFVRRAINEDSTTGDLQAMVTNPAVTPQDAARASQRLGFRYFLMGTVDSLSFDERTHSSQASISVTLYDAANVADVRVVSTAANRTGSSGSQPGVTQILSVEELAIAAAARSVAQALGGSMVTRSMATTPAKHHGGWATIGHILPIVLGVAALAVLASSIHSGNSSNAPVATLAPPQSPRMIQTSTTNGQFAVNLVFTASSNASAVDHYVVVRHGSGGDFVVDSNISALGRGPTFETVDSQPAVGQTYTYTVQAIGPQGQTSFAVPFINATGGNTIVIGKPNPATNLQANVAGTTVSLNWTPSPDSFVTGYNVFRSSISATAGYVLIASNVAGTGYSDNSPDLVPGHTYFYKVEAVSNSSPPQSSVDSNVAFAQVTG